MQTILYIEDNEPNRRLMEMLLAPRHGLRLITAALGQEGLDMARSHHPDLILLDMHLPDTSGETGVEYAAGRPSHQGHRGGCHQRGCDSDPAD